mmetsp:Transcript_44644/g.74473  ORF Transcript_44644/g.74473 Transcript_44644/m.74473 type:complete len:437 (-) Transcript_44644:662-1972(-)
MKSALNTARAGWNGNAWKLAPDPTSTDSTLPLSPAESKCPTTAESESPTTAVSSKLESASESSLESALDFFLKSALESSSESSLDFFLKSALESSLESALDSLSESAMESSSSSALGWLELAMGSLPWVTLGAKKLRSVRRRRPLLVSKAAEEKVPSSRSASSPEPTSSSRKSKCFPATRNSWVVVPLLTRLATYSRPASSKVRPPLVITPFSVSTATAAHADANALAEREVESSSSEMAKSERLRRFQSRASLNWSMSHRTTAPTASCASATWLSMNRSPVPLSTDTLLGNSPLEAKWVSLEITRACSSDGILVPFWSNMPCTDAMSSKPVGVCEVRSRPRAVTQSVCVALLKATPLRLYLESSNSPIDPKDSKVLVLNTQIFPLPATNKQPFATTMPCPKGQFPKSSTRLELEGENAVRKPTLFPAFRPLWTKY